MIDNIKQAIGSSDKDVQISITIQINHSWRRICMGTEVSSISTQIKVCSPFNLSCVKVKNYYTACNIFFNVNPS